jgi:hypothetical protein
VVGSHKVAIGPWSLAGRFFMKWLPMDTGSWSLATVHWFLMIVDGFPEPQPQVQHSQPAAQSAEESVRDDGTEVRHRKQQGTVSPLGRPRQDD